MDTLAGASFGVGGAGAEATPQLGQRLLGA
jgi:hypothetical protein